MPKSNHNEVTKPINTWDDLVYAVAARASELADWKIDDLRAAYPETTETSEELIRHCRDMRYSRGKLLEAILTEEFCKDEGSPHFDQDTA